MDYAVTVDDCLLGGHPKELDIFMEDIEKQFNNGSKETSWDKLRLQKG